MVWGELGAGAVAAAGEPWATPVPLCVLGLRMETNAGSAVVAALGALPWGTARPVPRENLRVISTSHTS